MKHPIKLVLEPGFGPVVDGKLLVDQLINSVRIGHMRKNTPISWNYAEHDSWGFTNGAFRNIERVPALEAQSQDIQKIRMDTGIQVPSDFQNQWFEEVYGPEHLDQILNVFGCSNDANGDVVNCHEPFSRFLTTSHWACNSRWALNGVVLVSFYRQSNSKLIYQKKLIESFKI